MCPKRCRHTGCRIIIIKLHQRRYFTDEMSIVIRMRQGEEVSRRSSSKISNLDPLLDENEVLRVGGRIKQSNLNTENIHSILLSGKGIVTNLLVKWYHQSEKFLILAKRGRLALFKLFEFLGASEWKGESGFFQGGGETDDFLKVIFNCWSNIKYNKKNTNYSNNHDHNVIYLLTIFKCLQLVT